jgi:hypothetical protein
MHNRNTGESLRRLTPPYNLPAREGLDSVSLPSYENFISTHSFLIPMRQLIAVCEESLFLVKVPVYSKDESRYQYSMTSRRSIERPEDQSVYFSTHEVDTRRMGVYIPLVFRRSDASVPERPANLEQPAELQAQD